MTAAELIAELAELDPTTLVVIDTLGFARGVFPADDEIREMIVSAGSARQMRSIALFPSRWPA